MSETNQEINIIPQRKEKPFTRRAIIKKYRRKLDTAIEEGGIDALTQLPNLRGFQRNLATEISRAERTGQPLSIMYLDLNGLKAINDDKINGGHDMGNKYIQKAAQVLKTHLRSTDVVARIGGDEFAAILPNADIDAVEKIWKEQLYPAFETSNPKIKISAGASVLNPRIDPDGTLTLKNADKNMYRAKDIAHETGQSPLVTK